MIDRETMNRSIHQIPGRIFVYGEDGLVYAIGEAIYREYRFGTHTSVSLMVHGDHIQAGIGGKDGARGSFVQISTLTKRLISVPNITEALLGLLNNVVVAYLHYQKTEILDAKLDHELAIWKDLPLADGIDVEKWISTEKAGGPILIDAKGRRWNVSNFAAKRDMFGLVVELTPEEVKPIQSFVMILCHFHSHTVDVPSGRRIVYAAYPDYGPEIFNGPDVKLILEEE